MTKYLFIKLRNKENLFQLNTSNPLQSSSSKDCCFKLKGNWFPFCSIKLVPGSNSDSFLCKSAGIEQQKRRPKSGKERSLSPPAFGEGQCWPIWRQALN